MAVEKESASELLAKSSKNDGSSSPDSEEEFMNDAILAAISERGSAGQLIDIEKFKKGQSTEVIQCRTALARRILNVFEEKGPDSSELFTPGRMQYIIPLHDESDSSVTTILRSKAEIDQQDESKSVGEFAFDKLVDILSKVRRGDHVQAVGGSKKMKHWDPDDNLT